MHDSKTAGHQGVRCTLAKVIGSFYWAGMYGDVVKYFETCHRCQLSKIDRRARIGEPSALPVPEAPWDMVHMDWITGFPESIEGFDAILVFTGMVHLQACKKTDMAKDTANHFVKKCGEIAWYANLNRQRSRCAFKSTLLARIAAKIRHGFAIHNGAHAKFKWQS